MISQQQRQIDEVSKSMCKLDGATQANAAASEETAASAQELTRQAEHLDELADDLNQIVKGAQNDTSRYGRPAHYEDNSPVAPLNSRHRTHNQYDDQVIQ